MQGRDRAACILGFLQWTPGSALNTTDPWICFAMKTGSVCVRCVASMDTRDTMCSNHRKRGRRDRYVMEKAEGFLLVFVYKSRRVKNCVVNKCRISKM